jgi:hypothetical protein
MLNFYGIRLVSEVTGEVARWPGIWRDRYDNLNWSGHNNLRISTTHRSRVVHVHECT